jgi:hypothetical protein
VGHLWCRDPSFSGGGKSSTRVPQIGHSAGSAAVALDVVLREDGSPNVAAPVIDADVIV